MNKTEVDGFLPSITKRNSFSRCDSLNEINRSPDLLHNSRSIPNSRSSSPVKLPTIDRSKISSTGSVASVQTNVRGHRSRERLSRRSLCRSPSCPSVLALSKNGLDLESPTMKEKSILNESPTNEDKENDFKLPSIFRNSHSISLPSEHSTASVAQSWSMDRERSQTHGIRRTESCRENYNMSPTLESKSVSKNDVQRSKTQTALLLPMRNNDAKVKGKKKKNFKRQNSMHEINNSVLGNEIGASHSWPNDYENGSFEQIMEESENSRHIDMARERSYKPWMKDRPGQKEGQVKA